MDSSKVKRWSETIENYFYNNYLNIHHKVKFIFSDIRNTLQATWPCGTLYQLDFADLDSSIFLIRTHVRFHYQQYNKHLVFSKLITNWIPIIQSSFLQPTRKPTNWKQLNALWLAMNIVNLYYNNYICIIFLFYWYCKVKQPHFVVCLKGIFQL